MAPFQQSSSPTPYLAPLPPTPLARSKDPQSRRELKRDSSSTHHGYVTATGLSNWHRGPKSSSQAQSKGSSPSGRSKNSGGNLKSGPSLDRRATHGSSAGVSTRRGLGMGMQSTPARRKKSGSTKSKSIGLHSTPKTRRIPVPSNHDADHSASSSSLPLSSLPDPDETEIPSILPALNDFSPGGETILQDEQDVFGVTRFIDLRTILGRARNDYPESGSLAASFDSASESSREQTLFPGRRDTIVPIHPSSSVNKEPSSSSVSMPRYHDTLMTLKGSVASSTISPQGPPEDGTLPSISHEDFLVSLKEVHGLITDSKTPSTHSASTTKAIKTTRWSSQGGSSVHGRPSTPYRHKGALITDPTNSNSTSTSEILAAGRSTPGLDRTPRNAELGSLDQLDASDNVSGPQADFIAGQLEDVELARHSPFRTGGWSNDFSPGVACQADLAQDNYSGPPVAIDDEMDLPPLSPFLHTSPRPKSSSTPFENGIPVSPYLALQEQVSAHSADWADDSLTDTAMRFVKGSTTPVPFVPSSQLGTPRSPNPSESTLLFSLTPPSSPIDKRSHQHISPKTPVVSAATGRRPRGSQAMSPKAVWRGAAVLKRMTEGVPYDIAVSERSGTTDSTESDEDENDKEEEDRPRTRKRKSRASATPKHSDISEDALAARQRRIAHYEDLKRGYNLHIELVL